MSITDVEARVDCDGCGKQFSVLLDTASGKKVYDEVIEQLHSGGSRGRVGEKGVVSYQQGLMLCPSCTRVVDAIGADDHLPTKQEIEETIGKALGV
jgi:hypothetical protein